MVVGENFAFVHLQKTAGSYVCKQLKEKFINTETKLKKHTTAKEYIKNYGKKRLMIGSLRNPIELYVSLWSYGCQKRGKLYDRSKRKFVGLRTFKQNLQRFNFYVIKYLFEYKIEEWNELYDDVNNIDNFHKWFELINKKSFYFNSGVFAPMSFDDGESIGFMSRRALDMYFDYKINFKGQIIRKSINPLINRWLIKENLNESFEKLINEISELGESYDSKYTHSVKKINTSKHMTYDRYYNEQMKKKIADMDKFIFDLINEIQQ